MGNPHTAIRKIERIDPQTLDLITAEGHAATLLEEINKLEAVLGKKRKEHERLDATDCTFYQDWRRKTMVAKHKILTKYREYKQYCKKQRSQEIIDCGDFDADSTDSLLRASRELIHRLRNEGVLLEKPELAVLVALDRYVDTAPV